MAKNKKISLIISAKNKAKGVLKSVRKGLSDIGGLAKKLFSPTGLIAGGLATLGIGKLASSFIETASSFEVLEASLTTTTGSLEKAREAIAYANREAAASPYTVLEYGEAIRTLSAYGIDYAKVMKTVGDTSASMGKPLQQAVEALADALQGEGERLKEFGIKQSVAGDQITYTWTDTMGKVRQTVAQNSPEIIQQTLLAIWNEKYKGGMDKFATSWKGLTSTAKSLWGEFKKAVMDAGLFDMLKGSLESIINKVQELKNNGDLKLWATKTALAIVQAFQHINTVIGGSAEVAIAFGRAFNAIYGNVVKIVGGLAAIQLNETTEFLNAAKEAQAAGISFDGRDAGPELDAYVREIETRVQSLKATADAAVAIVEKSDAVGASWKGLQGRTVSAANNVATTLNKQVEALKKQAEEQSKHKAQLEEHNKASELAEKYQKNLNTALEQGYSKVGAIREAYNSLTEDLAKLGEVSEQTAGKLLRLAQARAQSNAGPGGDVTGTIAAALDEAERTE
jgi:hypothetical protein